jgi:hypothetical protein
VTVDFRREVRGREVRGAFDDAEDISTVPTPFTPACYGHSLAPIGGPIVVRSAKPRDVVVIDLIELAPFGTGKSAILRGGIAPRVPRAGGALFAGAGPPRLLRDFL